MSKTIILWIIAFLITAASAIYQRATGPTYPLKGETSLSGTRIEYELNRSHGGDDDHKVAIEVPDEAISGILYYKRYKTDDKWSPLEMKREGDKLAGYLPGQPPAGKLQYYLKLSDGENTARVPEFRDIVIRFKGAVPDWVMIPHVIFMFSAMLISTRTGLQAIFTERNIRVYTWWSTILIFIGGLIFGPIVQKFAFNELWAGIPFGIDLTDNKTLIAFLGWLVALIAVYRSRNPRPFVIGAAALTLIIFLIPHSMLGSELDYSTGEIEQAGYIKLLLTKVWV